MLCPEVANFPEPKVMSYCLQNENLESVSKIVNMNNFYKSIVITCPDEMNIPNIIREVVTDDSEYYKLSGCNLTELVEQTFIEKFVKNGTLYCLSTNRNCIVQNCAAITPDGVLTVHVLDYIYQTIGLEGIKRPYNFYEIKINLLSINQLNRVKRGLSKLENFDFNIIWEPNDDNICPSSIAKYFHERNIKVSEVSPQVKNINPTITSVPSLKGAEVDEVVEWIGMLAHNADLNPKEKYVSTYSEPESEEPLQTSRISLLVAKGFFTSSAITRLCESVSNYVPSRELDGYWMALSIQGDENSLWQWNKSSPRMFQAHDSSCNIFFTNNGNTVYSIGQLKYS